MPPRSIPTEIFTLIFRNLSLQDLYRCLFVSHRWHGPAEAQLYSDVTLDALEEIYKPLITAIKTRRHLLRSIRWCFPRGCEVLESDLLAILFDNRPVSSTHDEGSLDQQPGKHGLQTGQPGLKEFSFVGDGRSKWLLELIMSNITTTALTMMTLTTLTLHFAYGMGAVTYIVDLEKILATFPYLKDLSIDGWMHAYAAAAAKDTVTEEESQYRLESLTFDPRLLCREGPDAFMFFKRLGNLKRIQVKSLLSPYDCFQKSRPWAFGRALKEHCPKLESVETSGTVALWLYDLPILLPSQISHIISLTGQVDTSVQRPDGASAEVAPAMMTVEQLRQRVQEQEYKELLAGKEAVPFFPQLKRLVMGVDHSFSFQDLISLGVQASLLTHLEICHQPQRRNYIWEMYEKDSPAAYYTTTTTGNTMNDALVEARRLRKRRPFTKRHLMLFLQLCSSLQYFALSDGSITFEDLIDSDSSNNSNISKQQTTAVPTGRTQQFIRPWACQDTLRTLKLSLDMSDAPLQEQHALVWKHLGRLWRLRSLTLPESSLITSFSYGVEGLLEAGMWKTLEEIRWLPAWWNEVDRREMVLWFARRCPRLMALGLEYLGDSDLCQFLEDEDVEQCSIYKIYFEAKEFT
ncbi:hypothetical protein K457DRAFT_267914 [Linnemannia elongata AG-77]|uniref:F-box domain-containing protein n=1 Tax=Linnemannia elongata AG-77 TaxID=1314771 RepID=A0A197K8L1_9FUNG|nr:hypothetical protein K457DRAFT_267914 [Linnemannia elongata AG-77]